MRWTLPRLTAIAVCEVLLPACTKTHANNTGPCVQNGIYCDADPQCSVTGPECDQDCVATSNVRRASASCANMNQTPCSTHIETTAYTEKYCVEILTFKHGKWCRTQTCVDDASPTILQCTFCD